MTAEAEAIERKLIMLGERIFEKDRFLPVIERVAKDGSVTQQWAAWRAWRKQNGLGVGFMDTKDRWTVPMEFPPSDIDSLLQAHHFGGLSGRLKGARQAAE